jgi:hypothetical protein
MNQEPCFYINVFRKMNEKEVAEGKVLFLRSLDGICPDIPLQRNKETVVGRRTGYGFEINHFADFRCIFSASFFMAFLKINKLGRSYIAPAHFLSTSFFSFHFFLFCILV